MRCWWRGNGRISLLKKKTLAVRKMGVKCYFKTLLFCQPSCNVTNIAPRDDPRLQWNWSIALTISSHAYVSLHTQSCAQKLSLSADALSAIFVEDSAVSGDPSLNWCKPPSLFLASSFTERSRAAFALEGLLVRFDILTRVWFLYFFPSCLHLLKTLLTVLTWVPCQNVQCWHPNSIGQKN